MYGGHKALLNAEHLVDHIGQGRQAVGGAAGGGHHLHIRPVELTVDAIDEGRRGLILSRGGEQHPLGAALEVARCLLGGVIGAGTFQNILRSALAPRDHGSVVLAEHANLVAVDHKVAV